MDKMKLNLGELYDSDIDGLIKEIKSSNLSTKSMNTVLQALNFISSFMNDLRNGKKLLSSYLRKILGILTKSEIESIVTKSKISSESKSPESLSEGSSNDISDSSDASDNNIDNHISSVANDNKGISGDYNKKIRKKREGGRKGVDDYPNAELVNLFLEALSKGDPCLKCNIGKLYPSESRRSLSFFGNAPINVKKILREVLRCNSCGAEFVAGKAEHSYDKTFRIATMLYKVSGFPMYRLSNFSDFFGIKVSDSVMYREVKTLYDNCIKKVMVSLKKSIKKNDVFYADDTAAKILSLHKDGKSGNVPATILLSQGTNDIVYYMIGPGVCGKKISEFIVGNKKLMVDASNHNNVKLQPNVKLEVFYCLAHLVRKFKDISERYPVDCEYFLNELSQIYDNDNKMKNHSANDRLQYHNLHSKIHIDNIESYANKLFDSKQVEPNSEFGKVLNYFLKRKEGFSKFLYVGGVALDNNIAERHLKFLILERKNSLFYYSIESAKMWGDCASLVATCIINGVEVFNYFNWLQDNEDNLEEGNYLPWDYLSWLENEKVLAA